MSFFAGIWAKEDGLTFGVTENQIIFRQFSTTQFRIHGDSLYFNWNDLSENWGPVEFRKLDENTIIEVGNEPRFFRITPNPPKILYRDLTAQQIQQFQRDGYLILRRAVDVEYVKYARKLILADIGTSGIPTEEIERYRSQTWVPTLRDDPMKSQSLIDVFRYSALVPAISSLVKDALPYFYVPQVALVFPKLNGPRSFGAGAHIDGIPTPSNGLPFGRMHGFSLLAGIALSTQLEDFCGNLVVYPGSHYLVNQSLQQQWYEQAARNIPEEQRNLGPGCGNWDENAVIPNDVIPRLHNPLMVKLQPGDAVICHYLTVHEVVPNYEDDIRMQLYLRVKSSEFDNVASMIDLWRDYQVDES